VRRKEGSLFGETKKEKKKKKKKKKKNPHRKIRIFLAREVAKWILNIQGPRNVKHLCRVVEHDAVETCFILGFDGVFLVFCCV